MKNLLKKLWLAEMAIALLIIAGVTDATMGYISLFILLLGIIKLSDLDALRLYIYSIPIFVALPANFLSESMSVWRFAVLFLALKVFVEKFDLVALYRDQELLLADKKAKLVADLKKFWEEIRTSNYYDIFYPTLLLGAVGFLSLVSAQSLGAGIKKIIFLASVAVLFGLVFFVAKKKAEVLSLLQAVFVSGVAIMAVGYLQLISTFFVFLADFWGIWNNYVINAFYGEKMMSLLSYSNTWFSYYDAKGDIPPTLRMFSVMPDSHSFSMLMILFSPLAIFYAFSAQSRKSNFGYWAISMLMLLAIWLSGSRGAWVGWLGAIASAGLFYYSPRILHKLKAKAGTVRNFAAQKKIHQIVLVAVLSFVALFPASSLILGQNQDSQLIREGRVLSGDRKNSMLQRTWSISDLDETSNKGRMEIWRDSLVSISQHPVLGIGMGNFPLALSEKLSTAKMGASAHNIYLDVAVELGVAGLIVFFLLNLRIAEKLFHLAQKFREGRFRLLAFSCLVFFFWIATYGFFDVVILNDKVLTYAVIILATIYKLEDLENQEVFEEAETENAR